MKASLRPDRLTL